MYIKRFLLLNSNTFESQIIINNKYMNKILVLINNSIPRLLIKREIGTNIIDHKLTL